MLELDQLIAIRRDLHQYPELCFEERRTAATVAKELAQMGFAVTAGVAETGVIGTLKRGTSRKAVGLRADMDALPIQETTGLSYASKTQGRMHACGHDGHTTILLGAAALLAADHKLDGTVHVIFQPAEEDKSGAHRMVEEGVFKRFPMDAIFALHNMPGDPVGQVRVKPGAITAAVDVFNITVKGVAGHGAMPHLAVDPIVAASSLVMALQTVVARTNDNLDPAVLTVGAFHGGDLATAIPGEVTLKVGLRTTSKASRDILFQRTHEIISGQVSAFGCQASLDYGDCIPYPVSINAPAATEIVRKVALTRGQRAEDIDLRGTYMFSEDFAFMLEEIPGCYFCIGNGNTKNLHDAGYDFNDELLKHAPLFMADVARRALLT
jgi:hippurate hydrolase